MSELGPRRNPDEEATAAKLGALVLPEAFKRRVRDFGFTAPNTGSDIGTYLDTDQNQQILGYLRGFNERWATGYLAMHRGTDQAGITRAVETAQQLAAEMQNLINAA